MNAPTTNRRRGVARHRDMSRVRGVLLSVGEAADILGVTRDALEGMIADGVLAIERGPGGARGMRHREIRMTEIDKVLATLAADMDAEAAA